MTATPPSTTFTLRDATRADADAVLTLAARLVAFGDPPGRSGREVVDGERRTLRTALSALPQGAKLLVAETPADGVIGFVYLETKHDYFTSARHGHVAILAVHERAEGRGVGRALLDASRRWAKAEGFPFLTISVFITNERARVVYERFGFVADTMTLRLDTADIAP